MAVVAVTSNQPGEGKTGVAAAIARHYAFVGRPVSLARAASDEGRSAEDAAFFASLAFAPGSPSAPVVAGAIKDPGGEAILVVEADPAVAAGIAGAKVVLVAKGAAASASAGLAPVAVVVTRASGAAGAAGDVPVATIAEDRTLAGFSAAEVAALIDAETLMAGERADSTCDHLLISPISADAGQPHVRRFGPKTVVVRFDRTDQHLAALRGGAECLVLTGGQRPSSNALDAAKAHGAAVLLCGSDTATAVAALDGLPESSRFQGERKLDRMAELLEGSTLYTALGL